MFKSMGPEEYITERLEQFQKWYDKKAVQMKRRYLWTRVISALGALLVPVAANVRFPFSFLADHQTAVVTFISLIVGFCIALESVNHFGDQWKNYRSTEQFLGREKFLFRTGEGPYKNRCLDQDKHKAFLMLVERCEAQISAENSATLNVIANAASHLDATKMP